MFDSFSRHAPRSLARAVRRRVGCDAGCGQITPGTRCFRISLSSRPAVELFACQTHPCVPQRTVIHAVWFACDVVFSCSAEMSCRGGVSGEARGVVSTRTRVISRGKRVWRVLREPAVARPRTHPGPRTPPRHEPPRPFVALGVARISEERKFLEIMSGRKLFLTLLSAFFRWAFRFLAKTCETNKFLKKVHKKDAVVRPPRVRRHGHRPPLACCERRGDAIDGPFRARGRGRRGCSRLASRALFVSRHVERRERRVEPVLKFISGREPPRVFCLANRGRELCWVS